MIKIVIVVFAVFLCGCATTSVQRHELISADSIILKNCSLDSPNFLKQEPLGKDIDVLTFTLQNGYGGRKFVPKDTFDNVLKNLNLIAEHSTTEDAALICRNIAVAISELPDNHLAVRMNGRDCNEAHEKLFSPGLVGKNISSAQNPPWSLQFRELNGKRIPVLSITTMSPREDEGWNGFLEQVKQLKNSAPAIIFDLRGNGGGDDTMAKNAARILYGQDFPSPWARIIKSQTPATAALTVNNIKIKRCRYTNKIEPPYLRERFAKASADFESALKGKAPEEQINEEYDGPPFDLKKGYAHPIYLLVDHGCQSSCESMVEAFEAHPQAITVGENTGGFIHFGNMGQLVLPESRFTIQMATDFWVRKDGKVFEKVGYAPKIRVRPGSDALQAALGDLKTRLK